MVGELCILQPRSLRRAVVAMTAQRSSAVAEAKKEPGSNIYPVRAVNVPGVHPAMEMVGRCMYGDSRTTRGLDDDDASCATGSAATEGRGQGLYSSHAFGRGSNVDLSGCIDQETGKEGDDPSNRFANGVQSRPGP